VCNTRSCKYSLYAPDYERKYLSKHVEQLRNKKIILHSCILLVIFVNYIMMHGTTNIQFNLWRNYACNVTIRYVVKQKIVHWNYKNKYYVIKIK